MNGFIAANLIISAYNVLFAFGMMLCMMAGVRCPPLSYILVPWIGLGAVIYATVLFSV